MQAQIQKWGNSLGIRIPKHISSKLHIKNGTIVNLEISNHNIIIIPEISELDLLLNDITEDNCHHCVLEDNSRLGNEPW